MPVAQSEKTCLPGRQLELDSLRGIAAIMVMLFHYTYRYDTLVLSNTESTVLSILGHLGVELFFMISGFVILLSLTNTKSHRKFITSRFMRLFPTYWICIIFTFLAMLVLGFIGEEISTVSFLFNLTMIHGFFGVPDIDGVYWTLRIELIFYAIMLAIYLTGKLAKIEIFCLVWLTLQGASILLDFYSVWFPWTIKLILLLNYCHLFIAGIIFYRLQEKGFTKFRACILLLCLSMQFFLGNLLELLFITLCFLTFTAQINKKLTFITISPLLYIGSISYSLYLTHQNIGYIIIQRLDAFMIPHYISIAITIGIAILLAHVITYIIEPRIIALIKHKYLPPQTVITDVPPLSKS